MVIQMRNLWNSSEKIHTINILSECQDMRINILSCRYFLLSSENTFSEDILNEVKEIIITSVRYNEKKFYVDGKSDYDSIDNSNIGSLEACPVLWDI